ncbi:hypothetical protein [Streptomonospora litoralis]|nr:hypothetical protein [Streptomonospora litoralis]
MGALFADKVRRTSADAGVGPETEPARLRAAKRVLQRGEPTDDAEANRLAVGLARSSPEVSVSPKFTVTVFVCGAVLQWSQVVVAVAVGHAGRTILFGVFAVFCTVLAATAYPLHKRGLRRSERISALLDQDEPVTPAAGDAGDRPHHH